MDDSEEDTNLSAAERAFQALAAEVNVTHRALLALKDAWNHHPPVDTTETLGVIMSRLNAVNQHLAALEKHPALALSPKQHADAIRLVGEGLMQSAAHKLDHATAEATRARQELIALVGSMRGQRKQMEWLAPTGAVALMVGLLLSPFAARLSPFGWDAAVAASILHTDRWNAGIALMRSTNPDGWATLASEMNLVEPNHAALT